MAPRRRRGGKEQALTCNVQFPRRRGSAEASWTAAWTAAARRRSCDARKRTKRKPSAGRSVDGAVLGAARLWQRPTTEALIPRAVPRPPPPGSARWSQPCPSSPRLRSAHANGCPRAYLHGVALDEGEGQEKNLRSSARNADAKESHEHNNSSIDVVAERRQAGGRAPTAVASCSPAVTRLRRCRKLGFYFFRWSNGSGDQPQKRPRARLACGLVVCRGGVRAD